MRKVHIDELTEDSITVTRTLDGGKNTVFAVSGNIKNEQDSTFVPIEIEDLVGNPTSLRLDNLVWLLDNNLTCIISYEDEPYFLPLANRSGRLELDKLGGLKGHQLRFTFKGTGTFMIFLDISKLGV